MIDAERCDLIDKLAAKDVLSAAEKHRINEQRRTDAIVDSLMMALSEKSGDEFETFLTSLSETGQQSVARVVREVLHQVAQTGHTPLHYTSGMSLSACLLYTQITSGVHRPIQILF